MVPCEVRRQGTVWIEGLFIRRPIGAAVWRARERLECEIGAVIGVDGRHAERSQRRADSFIVSANRWCGLFGHEHAAGRAKRHSFEVVTRRVFAWRSRPVMSVRRLPRCQRSMSPAGFPNLGRRTADAMSRPTAFDRRQPLSSIIPGTAVVLIVSVLRTVTVQAFAWAAATVHRQAHKIVDS